MAKPPPPKRQKTNDRFDMDLPLTQLALKYTHPTGKEDKALRNYPHKSGITPIIEEAWKTQAEFNEWHALDAYQRERFGGFTTADFEALESLAPSEPNKRDLKIDNWPIHPLYEKRNWDPFRGRHLPKVPLGGGRNGYWEVSNPDVWKALKPALQLASHFIQNAHLNPWWDALFKGEFEVIDPATVPKEFRHNTYSKFRRRDPVKLATPEVQDSIRKRFEKMAKKTRFYIKDWWAKDMSGYPDLDGFCYGKTRKLENVAIGPVQVSIATVLLEPLLRNDLTDAERATDTFRLMATILHETAHAAWLNTKSSIRDGVNLRWSEPFFEDECISELGFSAENALFGGTTRDFIGVLAFKGPKMLSAAGLYQRSWNNRYFAGYIGEVPTLTSTPENWDYQEYAPIPVGYFVQLFGPNFWIYYAPKYGCKAAYMAPTPAVSRRRDENADSKKKKKVYEAIPVAFDKWTSLKEDPVLRSMTAGEIARTRIDNQKKKRLRRITGALLLIQQERLDILDEMDKTDITDAVPPTAGPKPKDPNRVRDCPEFGYIQEYLFKNRLQLALDSTDFEMPENTLYSYIITQGNIALEGGAKLEPEMWRAFLQICDRRKHLFKYDLIGTVGVLKRIDTGWPQTPLPARAPPPFSLAVSASVMKVFKSISDRIIRYCMIFENEFRDHDLDDFLELFNRCYKQRPQEQVSWGGIKVEEFTRAHFAIILYKCHMEKIHFTYGPMGIIRKLEEAGGVKKNEGRNVGTWDICRQQ